ncbi:hypothetical protein CXB51_009543 [Gossypium anomalum]|uniref:Reverse transcriptase Ty1/copia-type domain-containing protein n=1 Tax=Gossypium anomalum TaxID=47600 RepID=A0A8J5Z1W9_9ROSI|nr:hypothetical protein CXB51_009543 [Gossypium anomalum]
MENGLLDRVEGNANVHRWSEQTQLEKGDSIAAGYMSELSGYTRISVTQNNLQELKEIWDQWGNETKQLFYGNYGDLPYLLDVQVDEHLFRALAQFWNPAYSCFTFGEVDLVPIVEEYTALLRCPRFQVDRIYSRAANVPTFWKKLMTITGMSEQWITARIKEKGECKCISWDTLKGLILTHPDETKKVDVFALSFKKVTSVPAILAETFRSLGTCRKAGVGRFVGRAQLLLAWFYSHFRLIDRVICRVFFEDYSPLKDIVASTRRVDVLEENWIALLQNLQSKDVEWRALWMIPGEILYQCGNFDLFVPATHGLTQSEFAYRGADYKKRVGEISSAWNKTCRLKTVAISPATTPEYVEWRGRRINDNIPEPSVEGARPMEEYLQVMPSELEIMKQEFERKNLELEKRIAKLEEEKMYLSLDIDVQKMEVGKERKEKRKIEEDKDDLKEHYKKAQLSLRRARVGGSSDQLQKEVQEGKARAEYWEKKFQEMQSRNLALEEENKGLKSKVTELGGSLRWHRSRDSKVELKELKSKVEDLEAALHKGKLRIQQLETQENYLKGELHQSRGQVPIFGRYEGANPSSRFPFSKTRFKNVLDNEYVEVQDKGNRVEGKRGSKKNFILMPDKKMTLVFGIGNLGNLNYKGLKLLAQKNMVGAWMAKEVLELVYNDSTLKGYSLYNLKTKKLSQKAWKKALQEEINAIEKEQDVELIEQPNDKETFGVKWVYKVKHNLDGLIKRNKVRLVVKGYAQQPGINYHETFILVVRLDRIKEHHIKGRMLDNVMSSICTFNQSDYDG